MKDLASGLLCCSIIQDICICEGLEAIRFGTNLWASFANKHGGHDLERDWAFYYENEEKYQRLKALKKKHDPANVFTPNQFSPAQLKVIVASSRYH